MPSKSKKQAQTMKIAASDPAAARRLGIPQRVAREFVEADAKASERKQARGRARAATKRK